MAEVMPFRGLRFNTSVTGGLAELIGPPYDVILPEAQQALYDRSPHNVVRLELPQDPSSGHGGRYAQAAQTLQEWRAQGVLGQDSHPSLYVSRQRFSHGGTEWARCAITAWVRLEEYHKGVIFPHEETSEAPKRDRLALMEACRANISPVMGLFRDSQGVVARLVEEAVSGAPTEEFTTQDGQQIALWVVQDDAFHRQVSAALADQPVYLADGHHRYETALWYRDRLRERMGSCPENAAFNYVMMSLVAFEDPGLLVLPYHRLVGGLAPSTFTRLRDRLQALFNMEHASVDMGRPEEIVALVEARGRDTQAMGLLGPDGEGPYLLTLADSQELERYVPQGPGDVLQESEAWVLGEVVLRPVLGSDLEAHLRYEHDVAAAVRSVLSGKHQMAFFLKGFPLDLFEAVVGSRLRLPPKSTYFHPKLPTGLVINSLEDPCSS